MHLSSAAPLFTRLFGSTAVLALALLSSALWAGDENDASGNTNPCTKVTLTITGPAEIPLGQATEYTATVNPQVKGNYKWTIYDPLTTRPNPKQQHALDLIAAMKM